MTKIRFILSISWALFLSLPNLSANQNPWAKIQENDFAHSNMNRQIIPEKYLTFYLDMEVLQNVLAQAPLRFSTEAHHKKIVLEIPMPDGEMERFQIFNAPIMHPDLAKKYPMINSYAGIGLDDKTATIRFDVTQSGFHAMILSGKHGGVFIDPYSKNKFAKNNIIIRSGIGTHRSSFSYSDGEENTLREQLEKAQLDYSLGIGYERMINRNYFVSLSFDYILLKDKLPQPTSMNHWRLPLNSIMNYTTITTFSSVKSGWVGVFSLIAVL